MKMYREPRSNPNLIASGRDGEDVSPSGGIQIGGGAVQEFLHKLEQEKVEGGVGMGSGAGVGMRSGGEGSAGGEVGLCTLNQVDP
jgi:hypothetical protein